MHVHALLVDFFPLHYCIPVTFVVSRAAEAAREEGGRRPARAVAMARCAPCIPRPVAPNTMSPAAAVPPSPIYESGLPRARSTPTNIAAPESPTDTAVKNGMPTSILLWRTTNAAAPCAGVTAFQARATVLSPRPHIPL